MRGKMLLLNISKFGWMNSTKCRLISYVQGQSPEPKTREYFYFIDHQGMLFLDDARMKNFTSCFKEKKFLTFFFKRLKLNASGKYEKDFPFLSPCGREMNFVRCDDIPIVFTHIFEMSEDGEKVDYLSYAHAGDMLRVQFEPEKICMLPESGRVYHPGPEATGGVGLIKSSLAIDLSPKFEYKNKDKTDEMPVYFTWKDKKYSLTNEVVELLRVLKNLKLQCASGRVYHPGSEATGGVGLIKSSLAIDLSPKFEYKNKDKTDEMPVYFTWIDKKYSLTNEVVERLRVLKNLKLQCTLIRESGSVYYPGSEATGGVGLIKSSQAIDLSPKFEYKSKDKTDEMPVYFMWKDKKYSLTSEVVECLRVLKNLKL